MPTSYKQFLIELYQEHIEEASFLYEQKIAYSHDPTISWRDITHEEDRMLAHIDALIIGQDLAKKTAEEMLEEGDPGVIYTYTLLCCYLNDLQSVFSMWKSIDLNDVQVINAIGHGLIQACPQGWMEPLLKYNFEKHFDLLPIYLPLFAYHKTPIPERWKQLVLENKLEDKTNLIEALGGVDSSQLRNQIAPFIIEGNPSERSAAITTLYLQGYQQVQDYTEHHVEFKQRPWVALTSGCNAQLITNLAEVRSDQLSPELVTAIGQLGNTSHIPFLINMLDNDEIAIPAAEALFTITGQRWTDTVFVEEEWTEDLLFEEELEDFKKGIVPKNSEGKPFGEEIEQISTNKEAWLEWWKGNQNQLEANQRMRFGHPMTPQILVASMAHPQADFNLRRSSYHELVIRYRCPISFSPYLWVAKQVQQLQQMHQWANSQNVTPGQFYFNGTPL